MRASTSTAILAILGSALARPEQPKVNVTATPKHFGILMFPGFQAMDAFGPLDILNTFSMIFDPDMHISVISADMNPVSTIPPPSPEMTMRHGTFGQSIVPTHTMKQILASGGQCGDTAAPAVPAPVASTVPGHPHKRHNGVVHTAPTNETVAPAPIEVLIVPGGGGTRRNLTEHIDFIKQMYPKVKQIISVCTGSALLAKAGVLDGRNATSNKRAWEWVLTTGPQVNWVHQARWVEDGNIWTSSGIAAGIDVTFAWIAATYGDNVADYLSKSIEYERWTDATRDPFADIWNLETVNHVAAHHESTVV